VEHIFPPEIAKLIYSIAICPRMQADKIIWAGTSTGTFIVRNAYQLEVDRRGRFQGSGSSNPELDSAWSTTWRLQVP
jgi:hypothetical protein